MIRCIYRTQDTDFSVFCVLYIALFLPHVYNKIQNTEREVLFLNKKQAKKKKANKKKAAAFFENSAAVTVTTIILLLILFAVVFAVTFTSARRNHFGLNEIENSSLNQVPTVRNTELTNNNQTNDSPINTETTTANGIVAAAEQTTKVSETQNPANNSLLGETVDYPADTASWKLICLNKNRCVDSSYEDTLSLSYVAGSREQMDSRAATAYETMYDAAAADGIYLTPCSGYRSYSTQKRLYYEFYNDYIAQGYSSSEAHRLTSRRRNPPGSSEHNVGICMDIICAASSANFENTRAYAWLMDNAQDYGFILRYPKDKESITGVKFEPWHWRYVGVENAAAIKNSGLCLEEYLGVS